MSTPEQRKKLRLALTRGIMSEIGREDAARLNEKGQCVNPAAYWEALNAVWDWLGPEGRLELDRQAGIDAFGNVCEQATLPPQSVKEWIDRAREAGWDAFGIAHDQEALEILDRMASGSNG